MIRPLLRKIITPLASRWFRKSWKEYNELRFWKRKEQEEGSLSNDHYEFFYTTHFNLSKDFYAGKNILDIGCGPRGSLEWADNAEKRIGLDPLADEYLKLGAKNHKMEYVNSGSESMPYEMDYFDVVCSFNSIDHVESLEDTISEIKRVLKQGGVFLLITDVNHEATACEPQEFSWDVVEKFKPEFKIEESYHFEKHKDGVYQSLQDRVKYNDSDNSDRYGILSVKFIAK
ncbi:class I SAM-dependent methyltransferase [Gracilimonas sp.]|uniref:class I SAM-dependent methyltransferase n=1 Tax=Gracilimonas sp. TaxID=1974203 RepID=UPI003BA9B879